MGFLDEIKKLTKPFDDEEDPYFDEDAGGRAPQAERAPAPEKKSSFFSDASYESPGRTAHQAAAKAKSEPQPAAKAPAERKVMNIGGSQQTVILTKVERFEQAADVADRFRGMNTVVMNLEGMNPETTRRLIDFLSGVAYALDGSIQRIGGCIYVMVPSNVTLADDMTEDIGASDFNF